MGILEGRNLVDAPSIPEYYKDKTIFITGGSGYMGKVLIEKLLYSCSDLDRIYLLMRCKKGVRPDDRIADLYASPCFDRLRSEKPDIFKAKVFVISGDIMEIGLGMSDDDRALLINRVNIVFHVAASVRFDDPLKFAVKMNLQGTKQVMELASEIKDLSSIIHVSTSYSNTNHNPVNEVMYPPHADWRDIMKICEEIDDHTLEVLTAKILGPLPNTYTFTKQLAENLVYEFKGQLPVVIFRPSIVISSVEEPIKGWIENFNGPVGLLVASGKGIMRSLYTDPSIKSDYMPVDIAIKALVTAAWARGVNKLEATDDITIYNCCAGETNNITTGEVIEMGREIAKVIPLEGGLWAVGGSLTTSPTKHYIKVILLHLLPAIFVDTILWALGKKPILIKVQRRIYTANLALRYYITQQWTFTNENLLQLRASISEKDKKHFFFEMETIDHHTYFINACVGAKRYLLKEKDENIPKAFTHQQRLYVLDKVVHVLLYGFMFLWFINTNFFQNMLGFVFGAAAKTHFHTNCCIFIVVMIYTLKGR